MNMVSLIMIKMQQYQRCCILTNTIIKPKRIIRAFALEEMLDGELRY